MDRFPHLKDSAFPGLPEDVYTYANSFDYSRWEPGTSLTLSRVPWTSDYSHTVDWQTSTKKADEYVHDHGTTYPALEQVFMLNSDGTVRVPIPYDEARRYNYLQAVLPPFTGTELINYEGSTGATYYYFIDRVEYISPSTTELTLSLDYWTTYEEHTEITYLRLARGHYAVAKSSVSSLFHNPIEGSALLLTDDVPASASQTQKTDFHPTGTGDLYLVLASSQSSDVSHLGYAPSPASYVPATFSNSVDRYGYQYQLSDSWPIINVTSLNTATTPAKPRGDGQKMGSITYFSIKASDFFAGDTEGFFNTMTHFLGTVKAAFLIPASLLNLTGGPSVTLGNPSGAHYTFTVATAAAHTVPVFPTAADFDLIPALSGYAKAYTGQYSELEISDNNGALATVKLENMTPGAALTVSPLLNFPTLKVATYLQGVGGSGKDTYTIPTTSGTKTITVTASGLDVFRSLYDIPTYTLQVDSVAEEKAREAYNYANEHDRARLTYQNGRRIGNTGTENTFDSARVAKTSSDASVNTSRTNAENSIISDKTIQDLNIQLQNDTLAKRQESAGTILTNQSTNQHDIIEDDIQFQKDTTDTNNQYAKLTNITNSVSNLVQGALSGPQGIVSSVVGSAASAVNVGLQVQQSEELVDIQEWHSYYKLSLTRDGALDNQYQVQTADSLINEWVVSNTEETGDISRQTTRTNADNTKTTSLANNTRAYNNTVANARYSQSASTLNAQAEYRYTSEAFNRRIKAAAATPPVEYGTAGGDLLPETAGTRGVQIRYKVPSRAEQKTLAAAFDRYGYTLGQEVPFSSYSLMPSYTYWEAEEAWVKPKSKGVTAEVVAAMRAIIEKGTTVWKSPDIVMTGRNG